MVIRKRCLLWDWTNTQGVPQSMDKVNFHGPICSVSNWNTWIPPELKNRLPYRPMVRKMGETSGNDWKFVQESKEPIVHFFNEPERQGISPQQAAEVWNSHMLPLRKQGKKLVSPSCANDAAGQAWIKDFMQRVNHSPPDFLGLHYYGTQGNAGIEFLNMMHTHFPTHHIIVSEIASISRDIHDVRAFTAQLANWMDEQPWILEYGFFGCMRHVADGFVSPAAQLMNPDGSFTDLMHRLMNEQPMKA